MRLQCPRIALCLQLSLASPSIRVDISFPLELQSHAGFANIQPDRLLSNASKFDVPAGIPLRVFFVAKSRMRLQAVATLYFLHDPQVGSRHLGKRCRGGSAGKCVLERQHELLPSERHSFGSSLPPKPRELDASASAKMSIIIV